MLFAQANTITIDGVEVSPNRIRVDWSIDRSLAGLTVRGEVNISGGGVEPQRKGFVKDTIFGNLSGSTTFDIDVPAGQTGTVTITAFTTDPIVGDDQHQVTVSAPGVATIFIEDFATATNEASVNWTIEPGGADRVEGEVVASGEGIEAQSKSISRDAFGRSIPGSTQFRFNIPRGEERRVNVTARLTSPNESSDSATLTVRGPVVREEPAPEMDEQERQQRRQQILPIIAGAGIVGGIVLFGSRGRR